MLTQPEGPKPCYRSPGCRRTGMFEEAGAEGAVLELKWPARIAKAPIVVLGRWITENGERGVVATPIGSVA